MWIRLSVVAVLAGVMFGCTTAGQKNQRETNAGVAETSAVAPSASTDAASTDTATDQIARDISLTIYSAADPADFDPQDAAALHDSSRYADVTDIPGFGVVRDIRHLKLNAELNRVSFTDVAEHIDPTSVSLEDLSVSPDSPESERVKVVQQKFVFDLVSSSKILKKYIDREVTINFRLENGELQSVSGTLLSNHGGDIILQTDDGIRILDWIRDIKLDKLPGGLITKPTLQWDIVAPVAGDRKVRTAYQTAGISWRADYNLVLNKEETKADLGAWVTVLNVSGASYPNAQLKLVAGNIHKIKPKDDHSYRRGGSLFGGDDSYASFDEQAFFEYHMYTLPRRVDIDQNTTQQLILFPTIRDIKVNKLLTYNGLPKIHFSWSSDEPFIEQAMDQPANKKVDVFIHFENRENNHLGIPMPMGKIRAYKMDVPANPALGPATPEFIGEDLLEHTARNQKVLVKFGQSFDVTGDRVPTDFSNDTTNKIITETVKITLKNGKKIPQDVQIKETLYRWTNWEITSKSDDFEKADSRTIHFPVTVPADGEKEVTYTVRYTW